MMKTVSLIFYTRVVQQLCLNVAKKVIIENTKDKVYSLKHKLRENYNYRFIIMV